MVGKNASVALSGCITSTVAAQLSRRGTPTEYTSGNEVHDSDHCWGSSSASPVSPSPPPPLGQRARRDRVRIAAQERPQALPCRRLLRAGRLVAEEEGVRAGRRPPDRERLGEPLIGQLALLLAGAELDEGVQDAGDVDGHRGHVLDSELA